MYKADIDVGISGTKKCLHVIRSVARNYGHAPNTDVNETVHDSTENRHSTNR